MKIFLRHSMSVMFDRYGCRNIAPLLLATASAAARVNDVTASVVSSNLRRADA